MTEEEREQVIKALAEYFVPLQEIEADSILGGVGADSVTPGGWGIKPEPIKRLQIRKLLRQESDEVVSELAEVALPEPVLSQPSQEPASASLPSVSANKKLGEPIFVVHGHARGILHETVRVLERGTGREIIVLHEQANAGRTILEKFENYAADTSFAVVLLTADDQGGLRAGADMNLRGRQNVIFELGFFFGKLGRDRVAVLLEENVEKPSDIEGLVYITLDKAGAWKQVLARELETAGISVDRSRIP
jgi:predicted nucleotide-binding protein